MAHWIQHAAIGCWTCAPGSEGSGKEGDISMDLRQSYPAMGHCYEASEASAMDAFFTILLRHDCTYLLYWVHHNFPLSWLIQQDITGHSSGLGNPDEPGTKELFHF